MISVLLPVRNGEEYITLAINSILKQTYSDFELLVINDGSTDNTVKILESFKDPRICIITTDGIGLVSALNLGLTHSKGEYIARMDADDISMPNRFMKEIEILNENENIGVVCSDVIVINEKGNNISTVHDTILNNISLRNGLTFNEKMKPIVHPSVMMRKSLLEDIGGYRNYHSAEDRDLWLRLLTFTNFYRISEPLLKYRINSSGISQTNSIQQKVYSMLAILNYEVNESINIDMYVENHDILEHFYKTFVAHVKSNQENNILLEEFKQNVREKNKFIKLFYLLINKKSFSLIKHMLFSSVKTRKTLTDAHKLAIDFLKTQTKYN